MGKFTSPAALAASLGAAALITACGGGSSDNVGITTDNSTERGSLQTNPPLRVTTLSSADFLASLNANATGRGLLAVATDNFDSVTEPRTREKLMRALVFFCGARIVVKGREHESQHDLLADAIRSVTDNPLFLESFFTNQILPNVEPAMQRRLRNALKVAKEAHGPDTLARLLEALQIVGILGYKNDSPFSLGRHLRDALSASLMISNERIAAKSAAMLLVFKDAA